MESNWRFNVADFGMSSSNWRLSARYVEFPQFILVNPAPPFLNRYRIFQDAGPGQVPTFVALVNIGPGNPHFPYGNVVEPD